MSEPSGPPAPPLPHATERLGRWLDAWREAGQIVLLLDYDGTLSPIVERPEDAVPDPQAVEPLRRLIERPDVELAVVSGRGMADVRERVGAAGIAYAGNHGMEIEGPELRQIHPEAASARPLLERVRDELGEALDGVGGVLVEDKTLTLSIHYRRVDRGEVEAVRGAVHRIAGSHSELRVTEGKEVLEVRPRIDWHKGRAVAFLLERRPPRSGAPVLYIGDDTTDEDAFKELRDSGVGEGVLVVEEAPAAGSTAAASWLRDPAEVADLLRRLAAAEPARS